MPCFYIMQAYIHFLQIGYRDEGDVLGQGDPTSARMARGPTFSTKAVSSSDLVSSRPTIPVLLTPILWPSCW